MSTPPTGEDPSRGSGAPEQPGAWGGAGGADRPPYGSGSQPGYGQPPYAQQQPAYGPPPQYGQQAAYGQQPGYGPQGPQVPPAWQPGAPAPRPPRDRKRTLLIGALVAVGLGIAACAALLVYVLSSTVLDRSAVESAVAAQFEERHGVAVELECRRRMIVRPGADYECEGTTADGESIEILITVTDENGAYTWAEE